jgi:DNA-binding response OmpR family regulator
MSSAVPVVEDDRELREVVRRYLERAGLAVHTTGSGAQALGLLAGGDVGLVVLDLGLPDLDGLEVLAAARDGGGVPVVVFTARSQLDGARLDLTPTEWGLLTTLAATPGRVYFRYELVNRVRVRVRRLRTRHRLAREEPAPQARCRRHQHRGNRPGRGVSAGVVA